MTIKEIRAKFPSGSEWYYINKEGIVNSFIIHSGISPLNASILSKVYVLYSNWNEASKALEEYNKVFTTFKDLTCKQATDINWDQQDSIFLQY